MMVSAREPGIVGRHDARMCSSMARVAPESSGGGRGARVPNIRFQNRALCHHHRPRDGYGEERPKLSGTSGREIAVPQASLDKNRLPFSRPFMRGALLVGLALGAAAAPVANPSLRLASQLPAPQALESGRQAVAASDLEDAQLSGAPVQLDDVPSVSPPVASETGAAELSDGGSSLDPLQLSTLEEPTLATASKRMIRVLLQLASEPRLRDPRLAGLLLTAALLLIVRGVLSPLGGAVAVDHAAAATEWTLMEAVFAHSVLA